MAMWAPAKEGKSELALWCAVHLALGRDPWTLEPTEPVDVAYFDYEMTEDDLGDRLDGFGINPLELGRLHYALLPRLHALDTERGGLELEHYVREVGARAAVIDTYGRAVGGDENEADTVRAFYRFTGSRLKAMGVGYWRTDHAGKDPTKGQRGSSAKAEDVDIIWRMRRGKDGGADLDCSKSSRVGWVAPHLHLDRVTVGDALRYTTPLRFTWPEAVLAKAVELDTVGLPLTAGRRSAEAALRSAGIVPGRGVTIDEALEYRRERGASSP